MCRTISFMAVLLALASCGKIVPGDPDGGQVDAADPCATATCECLTDAECGAHEFCDTSGPGRLCTCVAGYADNGTECKWVGGPSNAGFTDMSAWTVEGALLNPNGTGSAEPGEVFFTTDAVCSLGSISQTVTMPPYDKAEPLIVEITYRSAGNSRYGQLVGPAFAVNGSWTSLPPADDWTTVHRCLGSSGYGGEVTFEISVADQVSECPSNSAYTVAVDHFEVKTANPGQCAKLGEAQNGDAEADDGWTFSPPGDSQAGFAFGAGESGSRAAQLRVFKNCTSASMSNRISVPRAEDVPSPALQFWWNGTAGAPVTLRLEGNPLTTLQVTGEARTATLCLPSWTHGSERAFDIRLDGIVYGTTCDTPLDRSFSMDNVRVVSDPACGDKTDIVDPGFEAAPYDVIGAFGSEGFHVSTISDPALAHTGSGVLQIAGSFRCNSGGYETWVPTPAPEGSAGPALKLWHNVPANPVTDAYYRTGTRKSFSAGTFPEGAGWAQQTICLDPAFAGRLSRVMVYLDGGSGTCSGFGGTEYAYFDDFEVTTDAACPVN